MNYNPPKRAVLEDPSVNVLKKLIWKYGLPRVAAISGGAACPSARELILGLEQGVVCGF